MKFGHLEKIAPQQIEFAILGLKKGKKIGKYWQLVLSKLFLGFELPQMTSDGYIYFEHI